MWSMLAFFGIFGLVEFIRFVYIDWKHSECDYHVVVRVKSDEKNIESVVRNALLSTEGGTTYVVTDALDCETGEVLRRLSEKYLQLKPLTLGEYVDFLHSEER